MLLLELVLESYSGKFLLFSRFSGNSNINEHQKAISTYDILRPRTRLYQFVEYVIIYNISNSSQIGLTT